MKVVHRPFDYQDFPLQKKKKKTKKHYHQIEFLILIELRIFFSLIKNGHNGTLFGGVNNVKKKNGVLGLNSVR